jgi:biopolymer transport protein ExbB
MSANGLTVSMWIKPDGAAQTATLFKEVDGSNTAALLLQGDKVVGQLNGASTAPSGSVAAGTWHHIALVLKDTITVYVDGAQVAQVPGAATTMAGSVEVGQGFKGDMDELEIASTARDADWMRVAAGGQGMDQKLVTYGAAEGGDDSGSASYFKILLGSVTLDGWVVIGILMVMMVISVTVMVTKGLFISRIGKANSEFKEKFAALAHDLTALVPQSGPSARNKTAGAESSSMFRIYEVGVTELKKRLAAYREKQRELVLSSQSIDAIRASLDATLIRELQRMNAQMVLLTIAIAGGPFLGLLGTVVGVMITFAAIAAAGDVNVNAIAPGIAAALVATVAGLGVAIPSLFGYNYLASRIKDLSTDMQVFVDEFITRLAEDYSN